MGNFLENVFDQLHKAADRVVMREVRGAEFVSVSGRELLDQVARMRAYLRQNDFEPRDRCALLGPNSIHWTALDLALMAEGASNKMIARQLGISVHTVKFHVGSLLDKLDATGRTDAVAHAARRGVIHL